MDVLSAIIYGFIQGLTEFLPVSSSGHLALLPRLLSIKDPGIVFDLSMHVGTACSIALYFKKQIKGYLIDLLRCLKQKSVDVEGRVAVNMVVATMTTFFFALFFKPLTEQYGRSQFLIALNLLIFGAVMWAADHFGRTKEDKMKEMTMMELTGYGLFQALAIFPGVSRSGITLTYSRLIGMNRAEATTFSFLLALPLIMAGFILKMPALADPHASFDIRTFVIGITVSFVVGILTIHYFLKMIKKVGLGFFALYRIVLGVILLAY